MLQSKFWITIASLHELHVVKLLITGVFLQSPQWPLNYVLRVIVKRRIKYASSDLWYCILQRAGEPQDPQTEHQRSIFIHGQICHTNTFISSFAS